MYLIFFVFWHMQLYMSWYIRSFFGFTFLNILYFFKYTCTNIFHRRSLYTFYQIYFLFQFYLVGYNIIVLHWVLQGLHIYRNISLLRTVLLLSLPPANSGWCPRLLARRTVWYYKGNIWLEDAARWLDSLTISLHSPNGRVFVCRLD